MKENEETQVIIGLIINNAVYVQYTTVFSIVTSKTSNFYVILKDTVNFSCFIEKLNFFKYFIKLPTFRHIKQYFSFSYTRHNLSFEINFNYVIS